MLVMLAGCFSPEPHVGIPCAGDGECPVPLKCRPSSGTCEPVGSESDAAIDPSVYFAPLDGKQWLMPCTAPPDPTLCDADDFTSSVTMAGTDNALYDVRVRIRGVMERGAYTDGDGSNGDGWYVGGRTDSTILTVASIEVSEPAGTCFLNNVPSMGGLRTLDYEVTVRMAANADVKLFMSALDGRARADGMTRVAGVVTDPDPYLGQFAQIDVVSVAAADSMQP